MREREAGDAGRRDGEAGVAGRAAPAGLRRPAGGLCRGGVRGRRGLGGEAAVLGQEGRRRRGEVVVPLETTACGDFGGQVQRTADKRRQRDHNFGGLEWSGTLQEHSVIIISNIIFFFYITL